MQEGNIRALELRFAQYVLRVNTPIQALRHAVCAQLVSIQAMGHKHVVFVLSVHFQRKELNHVIPVQMALTIRNLKELARNVLQAIMPRQEQLHA